jgi:hypothetical protein
MLKMNGENSIEKKCAWCKVDTETQPWFKSDGADNGLCPHCNSYNDSGQRTIHINSMKQIYQGAVKLMDNLVGEFREILECCGIDPDDLRNDLDLEEDDPINIGMSTREIVRTLFLARTSNSGGTSTENLKCLLGIENETEYFPVFSGEESE